MNLPRTTTSVSRRFDDEGMAHFFRARFRTFEMPMVRDAVIIGRDAGAKMETLLATLQMLTPDVLLGLPVNDDVISAIIVREALLKKFPDGLIERFILQRVKTFMSASEMLRLDLELEIVLEASV